MKPLHDTTMDVPAKYLNVLKKYFGFKEFRPMQWKIVNSVLNERRDNCVIMATGYGKSLCYQFPPMFTNGVAIVISPLISLMQDQVLALQVKNIPATLMGTAQKNKFATMEDVKMGKFRLVYATPEWCSSDSAIEFLKDLASSKTAKLTLVAIDEAHCVSQWGMDFRKAYRGLGTLKNELPQVPFLALTATATPTVQEDICRSLNLRSPAVTCTSFDRPNLFLSCSVKSDSILDDIKSILQDRLNHLARLDQGSCIIYCPTKKKVDEVAEVLSRNSITCEMYHADLHLNVRERVHKDFVRDKVQIVVATVAFGMGIDKPDVRRIIHYGAPVDIETYYQEIGRAGRDGEQAHCHVFYQERDFSLAKFFLSSLSAQYRSYKEDMSRLMQRYLQTSDCRRRIIVSHFDPSAKLEENLKCCDNCFKNKHKTIDPREDYNLTDDALLLLEAVRVTNGRYGLQVPIHLVRGSRNQKLPEKYHDSPLFAKGYDKPDVYWKLLGGVLQREYLLEERCVNANKGSFGGFPIKTIQLSRNGYEYLEKPSYRSTFSLKATPEMLPHVMKFNRLTVRPGQWVSSSGGNREDSVDAQSPQCVSLEELVFDAMLKFRSEVAGRLDCMPYMIFDNHTIHALSRSLPSTVEELLTVEGFTDAKVEKFGAACLKSIEAARKRHGTLLKNHATVDDTARTINVKQFKKAKTVINYGSDESEDEGTKATTNTEKSDMAALQSAKDPVPSILPEDSFCDDDIFEGLATDDELISAGERRTLDNADPQIGTEYERHFRPNDGPEVTAGGSISTQRSNSSSVEAKISSPQSKSKPPSLNLPVNSLSPNSPPSKRVKCSAPHYEPLRIVKTPTAAVIQQEHIQNNELKKIARIKKIKL